MSLNQIINTENFSIPTKQTRYFDYEKMPYNVFAFEGDILYGVDDSLQVFKSIDGGKTWGSTRLYTLPSGIANCGGTCYSGVVTFWCKDGKVRRTTDDFVTVLVVKTDIFPPITTNGIARSLRDPNKIMFVEYTVQIDPVDLHVYYSANNGATWTAVLTKNHPTDLWHFHSVDFINGLESTPDTDRFEWIVTTGDSGQDVQWYRSIDDGATWTKIFGDTTNPNGAQMFRTLGIAKIQPNTYIWASDSYQENYVFACPATDLKPENVVKINTSWGTKGGKHWLVTCDKVEATSNNGQLLNRIYISGDSGGSWYKEYEFESLENITGILGIQGPTENGYFYVRVNSPDNKTIRMKPRKNLSYPQKPINQNKQLVDHKQIILKGVLPTVSASAVVDPIKKTVYEPLIVVNNKTDTSVVVVLFDMATGSTYTLNDLENGIAVSKTILAGQTVMIGVGDQYIKNLIPQNTKISVRAVGTDATSGEVIMTLYGKSYKVADHRAL